MLRTALKWSCSVVSNSLWPHGLWPTRLLCPWNFPGKSTGVGCHFLLQGIFQTQGSNLGLLHCRQVLYHLSYQGSQVRTALSTSYILSHLSLTNVLLWWLSGEESICQCRRHEDSSSIPGLGRSPGEGNDTPFQYSCLGNPMDTGAWWAIVHRVAKSQRWLSD